MRHGHSRSDAPCPACGDLDGCHQQARRIYLASSWRNPYQQELVHVLRSWGCEVYDFKNPAPGSDGFRWTEIDPDWQAWSPEKYRAALEHPIAVEGHRRDFEAMKWANICVLLRPAGCSASFEFGWCIGAGKLGIVHQPVACEPELMYRGNPAAPALITTNLAELRAALDKYWAPFGGA